MNHRQTVQAVARRLPHLQQHQVAEVLEVTAEVWAEELAKPGSEITLMNLGKMHIEIQHIRVGGVIRRRLQARHGDSTNGDPAAVLPLSPVRLAARVGRGGL